MKVLIGVQGHASAQDTINLNADSWFASGAVIGLEGEDSPVECWPKCVLGYYTGKAREDKWIGYGIRPTLMVDCLNALTVIAAQWGHDWILWTECDSAFFKPIPDNLDAGMFYCFVAGYCPPKWNCGDGAFVHPPYMMDIATARNWVTAAKNTPTNVGNGTIDVFSAIVCERAGIPIISCPGVWSTNGLDMRVASKMMMAREAVRSGCWHLHGIKRLDHRQYILGESDQFPADTIME